MGSVSDEELIARIESVRFTPVRQVVQEQRGFLARLFGR
jgi:hypothetical protein